ncbi:MAG: alpha/beta hydrolase [bacterium]
MKRFASILSAVILVSAITGCINRAYENAVVDKQAVEAFYDFGPIKEYGARCDHEKRGISYAAGVPGEEACVLDVYWNDHEGLQPALVQIHGGAWLVGDKQGINSMFRSKYLANNGYVVFNVNYRMLPDYPIQTQVNDVMGAVVWVKEHAAEYGADPEKVGVLGGSAGGHLTAMVAWASDDSFFVPTGHADSEYDSDVQAAVPYYGVFDLEEMLTLKRDYLENFSLRFFTGMKNGPERDELVRHISPEYHVGPELPPTLFICGDRDDFGLYPQSVRFEKKLRDQGVETGLFTAKEAVHGFDNRYGENVSVESIRAALSWFDEHLKGKVDSR